MPNLWTPYDPGTIANPYPMYSVLRESDPIHKSQTGEWIITRYDDIKEILLDSTYKVGNRLNWFERVAEESRLRGRALHNLPDALSSFLIFKNPPIHTQWRRGLKELWPSEQDFQELVASEIRSIIPPKSAEKEFVSEVSRPLAARVIGHILGINESESNNLIRDGFQMVKVLDLYLSYRDVLAIDQSARRINSFFMEKIADRGGLRKDGLILSLMTSRDFSLNTISESKLTSILTFLFLAGLETTSSLLTLSLQCLIKNSDQWVSFRKEPEALKPSINELIRFESPVQLLGRVATRPDSRRGSTIEPGDTVTMALGSANRDPSRFEAPDHLDFNRPSIPHLSFGAGSHYCLGDRIALMEASTALEYIVSNFSEIEIMKPVDWEAHLSIRRPKALHLRMSA